MQIPSFTPYFAPSTKTTSSSGTSAAGSSSSTGATADAGNSLNAGGTSGTGSIEQQFLDYAKESPMERMRAEILKSMGLTEDDLKKMSPEQQKAVEQKIEQIIKQKLEKNAGQTGQVVDVSA